MTGLVFQVSRPSVCHNYKLTPAHLVVCTGKSINPREHPSRSASQAKCLPPAAPRRRTGSSTQTTLRLTRLPQILLSPVRVPTGASVDLRSLSSLQRRHLNPHLTSNTTFPRHDRQTAPPSMRSSQHSRPLSSGHHPLPHIPTITDRPSTVHAK